MTRYKYFLLSTLLLSGCAVDRLSHLGDEHKLTQIHNPTQLPGYNPVSMPMPHPNDEPCRMNSLWQTGSKAFFKDQRANKIGDIITVVVNMSQEQQMSFNPNIQKGTSNDLNVNNAMGFEYKAQKLMPKKQGRSAGPNIVNELVGAVNPSWLSYSAKPALNGTGSYDFKDMIKFNIASTVIQILPNGNMVISGRSEVKLANEVREMEIKGIIRREDIGASNTIQSEKVAELRIHYGGHGDLSDLAEIPWGQQVASKVLPF
jgi:flagellar L-ring protein precursor FlgH